METNPTVESDAPLSPEEATPPAHPAENTPPEPVPAAAEEVAAETATAEALPEPLAEVEVTAEQPAPSPEKTEDQAEVSAEPSPVEQAPAASEEAASPEAQTQAEGTPEGETPSSQPEPAPPEVAVEAAAVAEGVPSGTPQSEGEAQPEAPQAESESTPEEQAPSQTESASPETTVEATAAAVAEGVPGETPVSEGEAAPTEGQQEALAILAEQAQTTRLSPADEERASSLLKEALLEGRAGVVRAVAALPKLPWIIGVNAVTTVWPELKPAFRTQLLAGLVRTKGDAAKRIRLSLARGLFKQDIPIALKIAAGVSKEMREKETGGISQKHAQIFANVFIGRAKPWVSQLPLTEMKPSDADTLVHCALLSALTLPHAPITQLGVLKWAAEAGRLAKAHQAVIDAAHKSLGRWSGKWQNALRREVPDLPESIASALKAPPRTEEKSAAPEETPAAEETEAPEAVEPLPSPRETEAPTEGEPDAESEAAEVAAEGLSAAEEPDAEAAEAPKAERIPGESTGEPAQPKPRPVYESKTVPRKPQQGQPQPQSQPHQQPQQGAKAGPSLKEAGVPELLRQLESQFQSLRSELQASQSKLRQRDEELRRAQKKANERAATPIIEGEPTPEELARLNRQLEARNEELQVRIEELLADSEARAVSVGAISGEPVADPNAQLRTLLSLKLQEDYEDFLALEQESPDIVVQQHYRTVLRHVFHVLTQEGVQWELPPPEGSQNG